MSFGWNGRGHSVAAKQSVQHLVGRLVHGTVSGAVHRILGPLLLGSLFDTLGRRTMIALTYSVSGLLLAVSGYLFSIGVLTAQTQTIA